MYHFTMLLKGAAGVSNIAVEFKVEVVFRIQGPHILGLSNDSSET